MKSEQIMAVRCKCGRPAHVWGSRDGYLCGCGIYFTFDEEIIFEKHLDPERGDEIADYMTKCQIDGIFEGAEDVYFTSRVSRFDRLENTKKYIEDDNDCYNLTDDPSRLFLLTDFLTPCTSCISRVSSCTPLPGLILLPVVIFLTPLPGLSRCIWLRLFLRLLILSIMHMSQWFMITFTLVYSIIFIGFVIV